MQLSRDEFIKVSQLEPARSAFGVAIGNVATAPVRRGGNYNMPAFTTAEEAQRIAEKAEGEPDHRDEIVTSLRNRIESGTYLVSGDQVADMIIRRLLADRVR